MKLVKLTVIVPMFDTPDECIDAIEDALYDIGYHCVEISDSILYDSEKEKDHA